MLINPQSESTAVHTPAGDLLVRAHGAAVDVQVGRPGRTKAALFAAEREDPAFSPWIEGLAQQGFTVEAELNLSPQQFSSQKIGSDSSAAVDVDVPLKPGTLIVAVRFDAGVMQFVFPESPDSLKSALAFVAAPPMGTLRFRFLMRPQSEVTPGLLSIKAFGGLGTVVRFLKVKVVDKLLGTAERELMRFIAHKVERVFKGDERFRAIAPGFPDLSDRTVGNWRGQRALLFVHGIFSSIPGAFGDLMHGQPAVLPRLQQRYGDRLFGWDHWTVAHRPFENAKLLLKRLPDDLELDIVCHSRGAAVVRAVLEHPALVSLRQQRNLRVGQVIFVAGANQGSRLAELGRWHQLINVFAALASVTPAATVAGVLVGVVKVLLHGARALPSLTDLAPGSNLYAKLNGPTHAPVTGYHHLRANFEPDGLSALAIADAVLDRIHGEPNDLVVPYDGAGRFDSHFPAHLIHAGPQFGPQAAAQSRVLHTNFFAQPVVRNHLLTTLGA